MGNVQERLYNIMLFSENDENVGFWKKVNFLDDNVMLWKIRDRHFKDIFILKNSSMVQTPDLESLEGRDWTKSANMYVQSP